MKKNILKIFGIIAIMCAIFFGINKVQKVIAGVPYFQRVTSTAAATTTPDYLAGGLATSTLIADVYSINGVGEIGGDMNLRLGIQFAASSTASTLKWHYEYSNGSNCKVIPSGCDWYDDMNALTANATTTTLTGTFKEFAFSAANTSIGSETPARATSTKMVVVPILTQYVRVVFYLDSGAPRGAVWAEWIGGSQRL